MCAEEVLDEAGLDVPAEQEDEVEKFREFLDQVTPEDFESALSRSRREPHPQPEVEGCDTPRSLFDEPQRRAYLELSSL